MVNGGEKLLFLKNNKYKGLITAVLITIVVALLAFKLIDNIEIFINIIKKFILSWHSSPTLEVGVSCHFGFLFFGG